MASRKTALASSVPAPARRPRVRLDAEARKVVILAAAERLFARHGYRGVTLEAVSAAAEVSNAGLLHHFRSKEAILIALLEKRDGDDEDALHPRYAGSPDKEVVRSALSDLVARNARQPQLIRLYTVLSAEALDPDHPASGYFRRRNERASSRLREVALGWHADPPSFAIQVLAFMDGLQLRWLGDPTIDLQQEWERFAERLFSG